MIVFTKYGVSLIVQVVQCQYSFNFHSWTEGLHCLLYPVPLNRWTWNIAVGLILYSIVNMYLLGLSTCRDSTTSTFSRDALGCLSNHRLVQFFIFAGDSQDQSWSVHAMTCALPSRLISIQRSTPSERVWLLYPPQTSLLLPYSAVPSEAVQEHQARMNVVSCHHSFMDCRVLFLEQICHCVAPSGLLVSTVIRL